MGVRIKGVSEVVAMIHNDAERSTRVALEEMRAGADEIAELAAKFAPVDKGNLEAAIKVEEDRGGINNRTRVYVGVDESVVIDDRDGKTVGDYAVIMHEGTYDLGPKSREKAARLGLKVGRKYLERAMKKLGPGIAKRIKERVKKAI